ncbi:PIG-L family deacetylase [Salinarimonas ramus]|uniref:PIG-L domain-containing protein n=1 Tax=Salinarimonas ramus TaxID=690164 RepID=A0A917QBC7_9HYPH|nr:PIG-L family deacetylase [Salinarimonas ramus]GGK41315.1 PIG-L domain-containing protein [Salinarimonas ramus]
MTSLPEPSARERLARDRADPAILRLHRRLSRLRGVCAFMNTGAHPDDEHSGLLAYLRYGMGLSVAVACSTRGEGGQNALGPERVGALGVLRTREMEEAARELDADVVWLGHGPGDPVHDFGFSKNGDDTLSRWGEARIVERLVRAYRRWRPDIVLPTFLDVPGQHGHHRAMTRAALAAIPVAADPEAHPEHALDGLAPWRVTKAYLPAWSGGGDTYDDETPPPAQTLRIAIPGREPISGAEYDRIGEYSRFYHASQGMGAFRDTARRAYALHLVEGPAGAGAHEAHLLDGLPATLADLAPLAGTEAAARDLVAARYAIDAALAAFPDRARIVEALAAAAGALDRARADADAGFLMLHGHRLERTALALDAALVEASGLVVSAQARPARLAPGESGRLDVRVAETGAAEEIAVTVETPAGLSAERQRDEDGDAAFRFALAAAQDAPLSPLYPPDWNAIGGNGPLVPTIEATIGGRRAKARLDLADAFAIAPTSSVALSPDAIIAPLADPRRAWAISVEGPEIALDTPEGFRVTGGEGRLRIEASGDLRPGLHQFPARTDAGPAWRITPIRYPHIGATAYREPAMLRLIALDLALPEGARIGYVGGGADRVGTWLERMGLDVAMLTAADLAGDLTRFTTIVVGIFAFKLRPDLTAATARLHAFVEGGGHLVTLYHRPSDAWDPAATPPRPLAIGSPSLRWRVTNPAAPVTVRAPDHPLLAGPNRIGPADWEGWDKERGLYFAAERDPAYEPLLAMNDPGEAPLDGALVSARIGRGRHTHTSLVLHHQLDRLVPGAFRLMANLVQPAS